MGLSLRAGQVSGRGVREGSEVALCGHAEHTYVIVLDV